MSKLDELISSLKTIRDEYPSMAAEVIEENAQRIEDLNLMTLYDGERPDGSQIEPFYTATTVAIKKRKGQPYDRVTTNDTGAFYSGIKVQVFPDRFEMIGTDSKTAKLVAKYGPLIGLGPRSGPIFIEEILKPGLGEKIILSLPSL